MPFYEVYIDRSDYIEVVVEAENEQEAETYAEFLGSDLEWGDDADYFIDVGSSFKIETQDEAKNVNDKFGGIYYSEGYFGDARVVSEKTVVDVNQGLLF